MADFDNDGRLDLYVTGYGGNALYRNLGDCRFEDVTERAGVRGGGFGTGAAWADYDRDGHVDLLVSRYVHVDMDRLPEFGKDKTCAYKGIPVQCGPWGMTGESDLLFHNRGDGTFEEVSERAGVHDAPGRYGMGAVWGDYDNDSCGRVRRQRRRRSASTTTRDGVRGHHHISAGVALARTACPST